MIRLSRLIKDKKGCNRLLGYGIGLTLFLGIVFCISMANAQEIKFVVNNAENALPETESE